MTAALAGAAGIAGVALAPLLDHLAARVPREPVEHAIPARRLVFALAGGGLLAMTALRFGAAWVLPAFLVLATGLLLLSVIDVERFLLPDVIVFPLALVTVALLAAAAAIDGDGGALVRSLVAGAVASGAFAVLHLLFPDGMAAGDVKLAAVLGLGTGWLGWGEVLLAALVAFATGAAVAGVLVATGRRTRRDPVPFGPFLAGGALAAVLVGDAFVNWYAGA